MGRQGRYSRYRILIVDDVVTVRAMLRKLLAAAGFRVIFEAENGEDALKALSRAVPDLILCDIAMEPMNGLEFVDALQRRGYTGEDTLPVIFPTSHAEERIVKQAAASGAAGFLVKPVKRTELLARIDAVMDRFGL